MQQGLIDASRVSENNIFEDKVSTRWGGLQHSLGLTCLISVQLDEGIQVYCSLDRLGDLVHEGHKLAANSNSEHYEVKDMVHLEVHCHAPNRFGTVNMEDNVYIK